MENDRKTQIIKAAVKRFSKHGPGKTTLDEIARDLRIGKATIYHYFISKEALFYSAIEWESDQFIEEIKSVFENKELTLHDRLNLYFQSKETIDQNYKLLYEVLLLVMKDDTSEKEKEILKSMLKQEETIIETVLHQVYGKKDTMTLSALPAIFTAVSWGWLFGVKLNQIANCDEKIPSKDFLNILMENVLPD